MIISYIIKSLGKLRVKDLKDICRNYEISGYSSLRKAEIVSLIARTLSEPNIKKILKQKGIIKGEITSNEEIVQEVATDREIDNRTYLEYLLASIKVKELKQVCRDFLLRGYSGKKKLELIEFILDSLSEEEFNRLLYNKELEIISEGIDLAINKIKGKDRENLKEIRVVNPELNEIELFFKGFNWEITSFLSITQKNIKDPDRDCDCRIGASGGFCSHFWTGFIFSLKRGYFNLDDWTLTRLPEDFQEQIDSIEIYGDIVSEGEKSDAKEFTLIDAESRAGVLLKHLDKRVTVYKGEISNIERVESEFQEHITIYYLIDLEDVEIGPQLKRKKDFDESKISKLENLKVRLSENKFEQISSIKPGDQFGCNGTVNYDDFHNYYILKRSTKPTKNPSKPKS
jgi:hypothetical protein